MTPVVRRLLGALLALAAGPAFAQAPPSILAGTIGETTQQQFEADVKAGAVALWAIGAVEAHGPHLPLATDVYVPDAQLSQVKARLAAAGVKAVMLPPYYWGVNRVTGDFPGSIDVRPEVMTELLSDVLRSLGRMGVARVYLVTGHYDAAHDRAILEAVRRARREGWIHATFVVPAGLADRIGAGADEAGVRRITPPAVVVADRPDLHGGARETSMMLHAAPGAVRRDRLAALPPTTLTPDQVATWRKGYAEARALTPDGYLGAPAKADAAAGRKDLLGEADAYADAILADLGR